MLVFHTLPSSSSSSSFCSSSPFPPNHHICVKGNSWPYICTLTLTLSHQSSSIKELLTLSRKIKELWIFGPLGQGAPEKKAMEARIDADVAGVAELMNGLEGKRMQDLAERCGGTWQALV